MNDRAFLKPGLATTLANQSFLTQRGFMTWTGDVFVADGLGVFRGHVGDNRNHRHWAFQITIALEDTFQIEVQGAVQLSLQAVFIRPNVEHRLVSGKVCSFYFDPASPWFDGLAEINSHADWGELVYTDQLKRLAIASDPVDALKLDSLRQWDVFDSRIHAVLEQLESALNEETYSDRLCLAALVGMSPSRFSHWFVEQLGVPLRSYKKWLKLRVAIESMLSGKSPVEAALAAGFSDQAHMSRAFSSAFGITFMGARAAVTNHIHA